MHIHRTLARLWPTLVAGSVATVVLLSCGRSVTSPGDFVRLVITPSSLSISSCSRIRMQAQLQSADGQLAQPDSVRWTSSDTSLAVFVGIDTLFAKRSTPGVVVQARGYHGVTPFEGTATVVIYGTGLTC